MVEVVIVLGLDPGTRTLGYGLVDWGPAPAYLDAGTIEGPKSGLPGARVAEIGACLEELLWELAPKHAIAAVGIESGYVGRGEKKNPKAELMLANARGVALYMAARHLRMEPKFVSPSTVKKAVAGHGHAEKSQVQAAVKRLLRMRKLPSTDAADALAVAIATAGVA